MDMKNIAKNLVATGKGILAADESLPSIKKYFAAVNVESVQETRRNYRDLLFTTKGIEKFISGVILFDETIRDKSRDGLPFPDLLRQKGIIPGIKVDKGLTPLPGTGGERIVQGLDGLHGRLAEYYQLGARFTKLRAEITIGEGLPTTRCIDANAHILAIYAAFSQQAGLVPVVEPEVLMKGEHTIERCEAVTRETLQSLFRQLFIYGVNLEEMLLKSNMVVSGDKCPVQADEERVAQLTVRCFKQVLPAALPGVVFLSGGQSPISATRNLNAVNASNENLPWKITFSYGRALQQPVMKIWQGMDSNAAEAQKALHHRAECNAMACMGKYSDDMETKAA